MPSGTVEHVAAGARRRPGCRVPGPGSRRARSGCPAARTMPRHQGEVEPGGLGRRQVGGHQDALGDVCRVGLAGQRPQHLVADGADVGGPLPQVGVGELRPTRARRRPGSPAQAATAPTPRADPALTSASSSASSSSDRWASKMLASSAPDLAAVSDADVLDVAATARRPPRRGGATRPAGSPSRVRSSRSSGHGGRAGAPVRSRCRARPAAGPAARRSMRPRPRRWRLVGGLVEAGARPARAGARPPPGPAVRRRGPRPRWPCRAPRVATRLRLAAGTGPDRRW